MVSYFECSKYEILVKLRKRNSGDSVLIQIQMMFEEDQAKGGNHFV